VNIFIRRLSTLLYFLCLIKLSLAGEVLNNANIGDPFFGINRHTSSSTVNQVGFFSQFLTPQKLLLRSEHTTLYTGESSRLDSVIRFDDGTLSSISASDISWSVSDSQISIQNDFAKAEVVSSNTRVLVEGKFGNLKAKVFIRVKSGSSNLINDENVLKEKSALSDSIDMIQNGWKKSNWFGAYFNSDDNWIYHQHHGWLFSFSNLQNSLWLWSPSQKWLWTNSDVYPHLFRHKDGDWLYFISQALPRKFYYNQSTKKLESAN